VGGRLTWENSGAVEEGPFSWRPEMLGLEMRFPGRSGLMEAGLFSPSDDSTPHSAVQEITY